MGRVRSGRWADRPANVEIHAVGEVIYFRYVFPDGRRKGIGDSREHEAAFAKARALNAHFEKVDVGALLDAKPAPRPTARNPLIPTLIEEFQRKSPKRAGYAARTIDEQDYRLAVYAKRWAVKTVRDVETLDVAQALDELTDAAWIKHRADLMDLFQFAGHQGYIAANPVALTMKKKEPKKVRQRHTAEGIAKILEGAAAMPDPFLHRAIRIALYSLQRRDDVVHLHKVDNRVDLDRGTITVLQRKTRNYNRPVWIEIQMGEELRKAVTECVRSPILCPYLIHRRPDKMTKQSKGKPHPFYVTAGYLSRAFTELRDAVGAYDHLPFEQRPTLHELRAYGTHLYEAAGYSDEYIMALSGHAKKETLERYKKDHETPAPRLVSAGLTAGALGGEYPQSSPKIPPN